MSDARHRRRAGFYMIALVLLADQGTKFWVLHNVTLMSGQALYLLPVLNFVLVMNHGITFGLFAGAASKLILAVAATAVVITLLVWLWRSDSWIKAFAIGAITGGAIGNIMNRVQYGAVVDFIQAHIGSYSWYVFNVGDSAICCGVAALMAESLFARPPVAAGPAQR